GFQPYVGTTALGSEYTDSSAPTSATTRTQTLTGPTVSGQPLSGTSLANGTFTVHLRVTRGTGNNNPDFSALVDFVRVTATYKTSSQVSVSECNSANNWTATKLVPSPDECQDMSIPEYQPFTVTRVFQGVCADGGPVWRHFEYNTATPTGTQLEFRFRAFAAEADGTCLAQQAITSGEPLPLVTASLTRDPPTCAFGSGANCPVDLRTALGDPDSRLACLQMDALGTPAAAATPELLDWNVLYDCAPDQ
ncbi:MAG TPA: hypothetical protein VNN80_08605, partial [Polyangiaceae bacterium]|nr:hypothetical protein [Polyangiaceae bacterium]